MSSTMRSSCSELSLAVRIISRCSGLKAPCETSSSIGMMPLSGVRISWLMVARNSPLAIAAASAVCLACSSCFSSASCCCSVCCRCSRSSRRRWMRSRRVASSRRLRLAVRIAARPQTKATAVQASANTAKGPGRGAVARYRPANAANEASTAIQGASRSTRPIAIGSRS